LYFENKLNKSHRSKCRILEKKNAAKKMLQKKMETKNNKKMTKKWMVENKGKPLLIPKSVSVFRR
jgi:hypothetical protein